MWTHCNQQDHTIVKKEAEEVDKILKEIRTKSQNSNKHVEGRTMRGLDSIRQEMTMIVDILTSENKVTDIKRLLERSLIILRRYITK